MDKMKFCMVGGLVVLLNISLSSLSLAEEQLNMTENKVSEKLDFQSRFVDPEIYIPPFDANGSAVKRSGTLELKGYVPSIKTSEERSEFLVKLDATRLDVREDILQYLYPKGPVIGYGWNINGSFYVTYYENVSVEENTTDNIYALIQKKAELRGIEKNSCVI